MIRFLLALLVALPAQGAEVRLLSELSFSERLTGFGGLSGLHLMQGGTRLLAVSDRGRFLTARIVREGVQITGVEDIALQPIRDEAGEPLQTFRVDAEGLAVLPDGRVVVSFEADHRVWLYDRLDGPATPVPAHPDFAHLQNNSALEALASDPDGTLYTIPERSGRKDRPFPIYRFRNGRWDTVLSVPRRGEHLVVGADIGPDGRLYVLEREYVTWVGFSTRVRRFVIGKDSLKQEEELLVTGVGKHDNLEGISTWRDTEGNIRISMVSDDNFRFFQKTELVEYVVIE